MEKKNHFKIVMLGNSGVGKTAFVQQTIDGVFSDAHVPTVGAQYSSLNMSIENQQICLELWDTAGQEVFRSLVGFYARDAKGFFILFDVSERSSFKDLDQWINFANDQSVNAEIILFANKCDLTDKRDVKTEEIEEFAKRKNIRYLEGSAKTSQGIQDAFEMMSEMVFRSDNQRQDSLKLEQVSNKKKKDCC